MPNDYENQTWQQRENPYTITASALQVRLGNEKLINDLVIYLTGIEEREIVVKNDDGSYGTIKQKISVGERKANDIGVQSLLAMVAACINPSTVQGNYTEQLYYYDTDINFKKIESTIMINRIKWGIQQDDYPVLTMMFKDLFSKFATRLINNGERDALQPSVVTHENITQNTTPQGNSFLGLPLPGNKSG